MVLRFGASGMGFCLDLFGREFRKFNKLAAACFTSLAKPIWDIDPKFFTKREIVGHYLLRQTFKRYYFLLLRFHQEVEGMSLAFYRQTGIDLEAY